MTVYEDTIVTLAPGELILGASEGMRRWARRIDAADRAGNESSLDQDSSGALGELAAAKWLRRYWTGPQGRATGDVGAIEVRTRRADHRDEAVPLILQPYDEQRHPAAPFVLVVGRRATYRVVGYVTPAEARRQQQLGNPLVREGDPGNRGRPCLLVDQRILRPLDHLRADEVYVDEPDPAPAA